MATLAVIPHSNSRLTDAASDEGLSHEDSDASSDASSESGIPHDNTSDQTSHSQDSEEHALALEALQDVIAKEAEVERLERETKSAGHRHVASGSISDQARDYQQELFERAKDENIIAVLDTGMGKTLIAAMLVHHIFEQDLSNDTQQRWIFFLANTVPLVNQQTRYLASNLPMLVQALTGQDNVDKWSKNEWQTLLNAGDVFVCTPAVLEQALFHNYVSMEFISLVIFDEAHHCKKNHPYSRIMRDYYLKLRDTQQRPKLFGMTASPVDSKRGIAETITELEELLHSKVVTVPDVSLVDFAYRAVDENWKYENAGLVVQTTLWELVYPLIRTAPFLNRDLQIALQMSSHLGTWFADRIIRHILGDEDDVRVIYGKFERSEQYARMTEQQRDAFQEQLYATPRLITQHSTLTLRPEVPQMSSKVKLLHDKLCEVFHENHSARVMVFVEQRWTAVVLCDAFQVLDIPHLHPGFLTGGGSSGDEIVSALKQEETMRKFNAGAINILFTTSVGEEGIDIPQCNLVVRFDPNQKTIQYIQSRGRARMKNSIYAHMIEQYNFQHEKDVQYFIDSAQYLKDFCQQLPPDRLLGKGTKLAQLLAKEASYKSFHTATGAVCNFSNCLVILSRYASSLTHLGATQSEVYEELAMDSTTDMMYQYIVRLPVIGESMVKGAKGEPRPNKILAKRSAAYECVYKLRLQGLLDDNLDSKFKRLKRIERRMAVNEKKHPFEMVAKPRIWANSIGTVPDKLYATTIDFKPESFLAQAPVSMIFLTRTRMPDFPAFPLFLEADIQTDVVTEAMGRYAVDAAEMEAITNYTLKAVFEDVFAKIYKIEPEKISYWLVPRNLHSFKTDNLRDIVDFEQLRASCVPPRRWEPGTNPSTWSGGWLVDPLSGKYRYITEEVVPGVSIFDQEPTEFLAKSGKKTAPGTIFFFTDSHWKRAVRDQVAADADKDQPVYRAEEVSLRRNYLDKAPDQEAGRLMHWIAPEPLQVGRLTAAAARTVLKWPSIIHRLEAYLIVLEGLESIGLHDITADLALEAHTKDSNIDDQEARTHATKSRGMGKNYERLEFIGDSALKMTSTISVYNRTTCKEGDMHDRRKYVLCNDTLSAVSREKTHMYRFIRSTGFDKVTWYPEHLFLAKGRGTQAHGEDGRVIMHDQKTHQLGNKTIADVSEATIGAAILSSKNLPLETRFDSAIKATTILTDNDDHRLLQWSDFSEQHTYQQWQLLLDDPVANKLAIDIERATGYKFKYPRLIRSAFTHPSEMSPPVPDYQRLEFLGDALFDWAAIWWLFESNPTRNPEWLTEHKMAMAGNQFLGALAVTLGFDKLFHIGNVKMTAAISEYARECRMLHEAEGPAHPDFWRRLSRTPPKALADLVEALIGAMLVDSNFSYQPIEDFFNTHVKPFFVNIDLYDGFANKHPTSLIYKTISGDYGCRKFRIDTRKMNGDLLNEDEENSMPEGTEMLATVFVHTTALAYSSGVSAKYAKVRACSKALAQLEGMTRGQFRQNYQCWCGDTANEAVEAVEGG